MKKLLYILFIFCAFSMTSCSSDDSNNGNGNTTGDGNGNGNGDGNGSGDGGGGVVFENYFPLTVNNTWSYLVNTFDDQGTPPASNNDEITVVGTTTIDGLTYFDLDANMDATGTATRLFTENFIRKDGAGKYHMEGQFDLPLGTLGGQDISITLDDILYLDESAAAGTVLHTQSGSISQTIQTIPMTINYTFKTVMNEGFASHTVGNELYQDVLKAQFIMSINVTAVISPIPTPITVLANQDVLVVDNYYAKDIGLVDSNSVFSYTLSQLPVDLGIPTSAQSTTIQEITAHTVAAE